jgi:endonuclease/exonuclease/phosphatase family metal-dependent hydrolase
MRLASYNIRRGGRRGRDSIASVLRQLDADVVALQEATDPGVARWLAATLGHPTVFVEPARSVALLARIPVDGATWHPVAGHTFLEVGLPGVGIRLHAVHLTAGLSRWGERRRSREVDALLGIVAGAADPSRAIVVGDLNAIAPGDDLAIARLPAWIRVLLRVDGGIQTDVIRRFGAAGFVDAFRRLHPAESGATVPASAPIVRLDYVLVGSSVLPSVVQCQIPAIDPRLLAMASDHRPLLAVLDV